MGYHYIPQGYLRQFAVSESPRHIWMYDLDSAESKYVAIKRVAQQKGYYFDSDEIALARYVEAPAYGPMQKLRQRNSLTLEDRVRIAIYMSGLVNRTPAMRKLREEQLAGGLSGFLNDVSDRVLKGQEGTQLSPQALSQFLSIIDDYKKLGYSGMPEGNRRMLTHKVWVSPPVFELLANMTWFALHTDDSSPFICSDNPVFWFRDHGMRNSQVSLPLSSRVALLMTHHPAGAAIFHEKAERHEVDEMNYRTAKVASRFLFAKQGGEWLKKIAEGRGEAFRAFR